MTTQKFNNEQEFNAWKEKNVWGAVMFEFGDDMSEPDMYPCVMVYENFVNPNCDNSDMEEQYDNLIDEGYDSDDIELLLYHYVYPTDFE